MSRKSTIISNWPKFLLQWGVISAIVVFFTGAVPAFNSAVEGMSVKMIPVQELSAMQIAKGIGIFAALVLFGKLFCGFICPSGAIQDLLMKLHKPLHIKTFHITNRSIADLVLRFVKYALVFCILYLIISGFESKTALWIGIVTLCLMIAGSFIIDRFWCRYICPLGAMINSLKFWIWLAIPAAAWYAVCLFVIYIPWEILLGVLCLMTYLLEICRDKPKMQLVHVMKDEMACIHCNTCISNCPYHIDIKPCHNGKIKSIDCNLCGECVASCPAGALNFGVKRESRGRFWKYIPALLTIAVVILLIWATGNL